MAGRGRQSQSPPINHLFPHRCTDLFGTPTIFVDMVNYQHLDKYDLSSVYGGEKNTPTGRFSSAIPTGVTRSAPFCSGCSAGVIGGAPCSPELMKDMIVSTGIKKITVSLDFINNNVILGIVAKMLVLTEKKMFVSFGF